MEINMEEKKLSNHQLFWKGLSHNRQTGKFKRDKKKGREKTVVISENGLRWRLNA